MTKLMWILVLWVFFAAASISTADLSIGFQFYDRTEDSGIDHFTVYGGQESNRYLLETTGSGAAFFDYDNDGWLDLFLVNGSRLEGFPEGEHPSGSLYRNRGDGTFQDVTIRAGTVHPGWGQAVCAGDYDNDGRVDFFVTYWGQNVLYHNLGDGTFENSTPQAGLVQQRRRWNSGCAFLDYDRDGHLDLFIANYIDFDPETTPTPDSGLCLYKGIEVACGPPGLTGGKNILYSNQGDGTFIDVSRQSGILESGGTYGLGVLTSDFNNDGWPDIYVANDSNPSTLYQNNQDGTFTDIAVLAGAAYSQDGKPQAGMGVSAADFNHDDRFDIFKTNFAGDTANLYVNLGDDLFEELSFLTGIGVNTRWLGWGCGFADFNNDGWVDIFQVNGHVYPEVFRLKTEAQYRQRKVVYLNQRNGKFQDITEKLGGAVLEPRAGRGAAFGDFDNDGDIDVLVNNVNDRATLYVTESRNSNHWISIRLEGVQSNRSAIGARVSCRTKELTQVDEVRSGGSYYSQNQFRVHFGLGESTEIDEIEIRWPSGKIEKLENIPVDSIIHIVEGKGIREGG